MGGTLGDTWRACGTYTTPPSIARSARLFASLLWPRQTGCSLGAIDIKVLEESLLEESLQGHTVGLSCGAIGCPHCRMLYFGHPRRWQDALCWQAVPLQPTPDSTRSLAATQPSTGAS